MDQRRRTRRRGSVGQKLHSKCFRHSSQKRTQSMWKRNDAECARDVLSGIHDITRRSSNVYPKANRQSVFWAHQYRALNKQTKLGIAVSRSIYSNARIQLFFASILVQLETTPVHTALFRAWSVFKVSNCSAMPPFNPLPPVGSLPAALTASSTSISLISQAP